MLRNAGRILLAIGLGWCALVEAVEIFANVLFHMRVDGDWFLLIAASSGEEMAGFVQLYGQQLTLAVAGLIVLLGLIVTGALFAKSRWWWGFLAVVFLYVGWNCRTPSKAMHWAPVYLAYDTVRSAAQYAELIRAGRWTGEEEQELEAERRNLVVVIGESMTTDRMSLYGYEKPTTPHLDGLKDRMTVMPPVRPNFADTVRSIRMMFTRASAAHPERAIETSAVAFRKRGYRPVFIGAQPKWGRYCGVEHLVFGACETRTYIGEPGLVMDAEVVSYVTREIAFSDDQPFVIFVQLQGSHFDPKWRVPPDFKTPEDWDDYDRSILYTDYVLEELMRALPPKTTLVYLSDHGESPDSSGWRNADSPSMWKVPLIVYPKNDKITPIQTLDQVFDLLLETACIH